MLAMVPISACAPAAPAAKNWVLTVGREGTFGYATAVAMARLAEKYVPDLTITVIPGNTNTANQRIYSRGEANFAYTNILTMKDIWENAGYWDEDPLPNPRYKLYHGVTTINSAHFILVRKDNTDINSYSDLAGKKLWPDEAGSGSYVQCELMFGELGLDIWEDVQVRQMGAAEIPDALNTGVIDAIWAYAIGGLSLSGKWQELDARSEIKVIQPTEAEKAIISKVPGLVAPYPTDPKVFTQDVGVDEIWGISIPFGYSAGPREDEETVYLITKAWYEHSDELLAVAEGFREMHEKGVGMCEIVVSALPTVPVHPGIAKYMKEMNVWHDNFIVGELYND